MGAETKTRSALPVGDPYTSLHFHFGMLLGVEDFEVLAGNARAKGWMHQAWLHGAGVVWGLDVGIDAAAEEVRVEPGLGVDGLGREVRVDEPMCARLPRWFAEHRDDPELDVTDQGDGRFSFEVWVLAEAQTCLTRPVPAVSDGCDHDGIGSAYSRVVETAKLTLAAQPPPEPSELLPRTRLWLGLRAPTQNDDGSVVAEDQTLLDASRAIADPGARQTMLQTLLREDITARRPAVGDLGQPHRTPVAPPGALTLARLSVTVRADGDGFELVAAESEVDPSVRQVIVPTSVLQDILLERAGASSGALGPQVADMALAGDILSFELSADLFAASVRTGAFAVRRFDEAAGWQTVDVAEAGLDGGHLRRVRVRLAAAPAAGARLRVVARGSGPEPLLGADGLPLAGALGYAPAGDEGRDYVRGLVVE